MAKHRKHHKKGHRSFGFLPKLNLGGTASLKDTGIAALIGVAGGLGAQYAVVKYNEHAAANQKKPVAKDSLVGYLVPFLGGAVVGVGGYFVKKKSNAAKANVYLVGGLLGGLIAAAFKFATTKYAATFGDLVKVRLGGMGNILINEGALGRLGNIPVGGAAVPAQKQARLGNLAAAAMSPAARSAMGGLMRVRA